MKECRLTYHPHCFVVLCTNRMVFGTDHHHRCLIGQRQVEVVKNLLLLRPQTE